MNNNQINISIKITNNRHSIRIVVRFNNKSYFIYPGLKDNHKNRLICLGIKKIILADIEQNEFDYTSQRYKYNKYKNKDVIENIKLYFIDVANKYLSKGGAGLTAYG